MDDPISIQHQTEDFSVYQRENIQKKRERKKKNNRKPTHINEKGVPVGTETCTKCQHGRFNQYNAITCTCKGCSPMYEESLKKWMCYCFQSW